MLKEISTMLNAITQQLKEKDSPWYILYRSIGVSYSIRLGTKGLCGPPGLAKAGVLLAGHARRRCWVCEDVPRVSTGQGRAVQTPGALEAVVCTTKTMGECLHRFFRGSAKKGSMGLDRDGPTHKQNMSFFFPLSHPYTTARVAQIFVDNIFIAWNATLNCQRQGTRSSLAISGRSSFV